MELITLSILLVEDNEEKIGKIKHLISEYENIRLEIRTNQIDSLEILGKENFDLLILDMQLPLRHGEDPEVNGGEKILEELEVDQTLLQPSTLIVLTQYENSQNHIREYFSDIAAIKFDNTSNKWQDAIKRTVSRILKSKNYHKKIVYCEGQNAKFYNLIGLTEFEFRGLIDCRAIYLAAKNEHDKFSLRDRDFLTEVEIASLQKLFKNYFILKYYCFENYIYHPDNISEAYPNFDSKLYIDDLISQKNSKLLTIIQDYKMARSGYTDFTDNEKKNMDSKPEKEIVTNLQSNELEKFYPYFDMAGKKDKGNLKSYDKSFLMKYNLETAVLAKTAWLKDRITELLISN